MEGMKNATRYCSVCEDPEEIAGTIKSVTYRHKSNEKNREHTKDMCEGCIELAPAYGLVIIKVERMSHE